MRMWSLPDLQMSALLLKLKVHLGTSFPWLVLANGAGSALPISFTAEGWTVVLLAGTHHAPWELLRD